MGLLFLLLNHIFFQTVTRFGGLHRHSHSCFVLIFVEFKRQGVDYLDIDISLERTRVDASFSQFLLAENLLLLDGLNG